MRNTVVLLLALCLLSVDRCSKMPRRFLGAYKGVSPETTLVVNKTSALVQSTPIQMILSEETISLMIGQTVFETSYTVNAITKNNFSITATFPEPLGSCVFSIAKKGKKAIWKRPYANQELILLKD